MRNTNEGATMGDNTAMTCTCCGSTVNGNRVIEADGTEFELDDES